MSPCCFRLEVMRGPHAGSAHRYCWKEQSEPPSSLSIGRRKSCWLRLPQDLEVSSLHAELRVLEGFQGSGLAVRDAKSTNGSKLNGQALQPQLDYPLRDGDLIGVGRTSLCFVEVVHGQPCGEVDAAAASAEAAIPKPTASSAALPEVIVLDDESAEEKETSGSASVEAGSSAAGSSETPADQPDTEPARDEVVLKPVNIVVNAGKSKREKERESEVEGILVQKARDGKESGSRTGCVNECTPEDATCTKCRVVIGQLDLLAQQAHLNECLGGRVAAANTAVSTATAPVMVADIMKEDKPKTRKRANANSAATRVKKPRKPRAGDDDGTSAGAPKAKKPRKRKRADAGEDIELALMMAGNPKMDKEQQTDAKLAVARKKLEQLDVQMAKLTKRRANLVKTLDRLERAKEKLRKSQVLPPAKVRELLDLKAALEAIFPSSRQASAREQRGSTREADTVSVVAQRYAPLRRSELGTDVDCDEEKRAELAAVAAISMWARASQQLFGLSRDTLLYRNNILRRFLGDEDNADDGNMDLLNEVGDDEDTADGGVDIDRGESEAEGELVPMPQNPSTDRSSECTSEEPEVPDVVKRVFPNWQRDLAFLQDQTAKELEMALEALGEAQAEADAEAAKGGDSRVENEEFIAGGSDVPSARKEQRQACEYMARVMKQLIVEKRPQTEVAETMEHLHQQPLQQQPGIDLVTSSGEDVPQPEEHESIVGASDNEVEEEPYTPAPDELPKAAVGSQPAVRTETSAIEAELEQNLVSKQ